MVSQAVVITTRVAADGGRDARAPTPGLEGGAFWTSLLGGLNACELGGVQRAPMP